MENEKVEEAMKKSACTRVRYGDEEEGVSWMFWRKRRYIVAVLAFCGFFVSYILRVNLSVAIVKMTSNRTCIDDSGQIKHEQEFDWDSRLQGLVLSSFFYGYISTQLLGGWLASRIGGKRVFGFGIAVTALFTIITPVITRYSVYLLVAVRVLEGVCEGVTYPCIHAIWANWAPPLERSKLATLAFSGSFVGTVFAMPVCGIMAERLGWASIFYVFGIIGILWYICWSFVVTDRPENDPQISEIELKYIKRTLGSPEKEKISHPWKAMFLSPAVWAIVAAHFSENWGFYTMLTQLPTFMNDVLNFKLEKTGFLSALPYLVMAIVLQFSGHLADYLRSRKILTTTQCSGVFVPHETLASLSELLYTRIAIMDNFFSQNSSNEPDDISQIENFVWILGKKYNSKKDIDAIRRDIRSRLWFTYRKGFVPIGGFGSTFTSDKGWGCMLRCGQMVLGQALISLHLGRNWRWTPETKCSTYFKILKRFEDRRAAPYSIHQIALMGASEGKDVGQWFGPNTVAQVLKKLVVYDDWSSITIHVALDNALVVNDVIRQCCVEGATTVEVDGEKPLKAQSQWKPLLLLIPLRLGLSEINPVYINGIKTSFQFPQSLGLIGGKPSHALYFIGYVGDEVIFLDPHTTQKSGSVDQKSDENEVDMDATYHCKIASRIPITEMDPSVALCFFCAGEKEFRSLCRLMQEKLILNEKQPLFEICSERPANWSPAEDVAAEALGATASTLLGPTSDEGFELLG